jgi:hypothetical protein
VKVFKGLNLSTPFHKKECKMRIYTGYYGHSPVDKRGRVKEQYTYYGPDNLHTGQNTTVRAFNKKAGRTIQTMYTIAGSSAFGRDRGAAFVRNVPYNVHIRKIQGTDAQAELPGGANYKSNAEWRRKSLDEMRSRFGANDFNDMQASALNIMRERFI